MLEVLDFVARGGEVSVHDVALETGLTRGTIAAVLPQLERLGLIDEVRHPDDVGGQAPTIRLHAEAAVALCVDIGNRHVAVGVGGPRGLLAAPMIHDHDDELAPLEALELAAALVRDLVPRVPSVEPRRLVGVCVSVAAPLDQVQGMVTPRSGMDVWIGVRPATELQYRLGAQWSGLPFLIQNNANLDVLAAAPQNRDRRKRELCQDALLLVRWGNGIGGAALLNGELIVGTRGIATEIGHTPVQRELADAAPCPRCGHVCLDSVASGDALTRALLARSGRIQSFDELIQTAVASDGIERQLLTSAAREIGETVGTYVSFLDARLLIISGYHFVSTPDDAAAYNLIADPLRTGMRATSFPPVLEDVEVTFGAHARSATIEGGVALVLHTYLARHLAQTLT